MGENNVSLMRRHEERNTLSYIEQQRPAYSSEIEDGKKISIKSVLLDPQHAFQLAEENGHVLIEQDGSPRYLMIDLEKEPQIEMTEDEKLEFVARRILREHHAAFEELAK